MLTDRFISELTPGFYSFWYGIVVHSVTRTMSEPEICELNENQEKGYVDKVPWHSQKLCADWCPCMIQCWNSKGWTMYHVPYDDALFLVRILTDV